MNHIGKLIIVRANVSVYPTEDCIWNVASFYLHADELAIILRLVTNRFGELCSEIITESGSSGWVNDDNLIEYE